MRQAGYTLAAEVISFVNTGVTGHQGVPVDSHYYIRETIFVVWVGPGVALAVFIHQGVRPVELVAVSCTFSEHDVAGDAPGSLNYGHHWLTDSYILPVPGIGATDVLSLVVSINFSHLLFAIGMYWDIKVLALLSCLGALCPYMEMTADTDDFSALVPENSFYCGTNSITRKLALFLFDFSQAALIGEPVAYNQVPWFWSDQYNVKMQIAGMSDVHEQFVMRGDPRTRSFAAFYLQQGKIVAVDAINSPREFMLGKKLVAAGAKIPIKDLADTSKDFKEMATAALEATSAQA